MKPPRPSWACEIESWAVALRAAGRSGETIGLRTYHARRLAGWAGERDPWDLDLDDLLAFMGARAWRRSTVRSYRASLRSFYAWAALTGRVSVSPAEGLPAPGPTRPEPHPTPEDAYRLALAIAGPRERLMVRLAADLGMRRGEVCRVHSRDVHRDLLGWSLLVHGKGDRTRVVPLPDDLARRLLALPPGWVFPGEVDGHLSARWVGRLVSRLLPVGWSMHSLRHRFATKAWGVDHDLLTVQELLGHASPVTTRAYVGADEDVKRRHVVAIAALR
jgi:integrase